jgi:hypothetical protein
MGGPNILAFAALWIYPLIVWQLWKRLPAPQALVWTILAGYLALPEATSINFPMVPDFTKVTIPNLAALAMAFWLLGDRMSFLPYNPIGRAMILVYLISPFLTVMTNTEPLFFTEAMIQGMRPYDSVSGVVGQALALLPLFLGRRYLGNAEGADLILRALVAGAMVYSLPILIEAAISPQLHSMVYGFMQHDFSQTLRAGGYRPMVFMPHGLWLAFFVASAVIAAIALFRSETPEGRPKALIIAGGLMVILVVCKSAGPMIYGIVFGLCALILPRRGQILIGALIALIVISYPALRGSGLFPIEDIQSLATKLGAERAQSFNFRVENEEQLLNRAQLKPWFGWGGYGRNSEHDPITGQIITIGDGAWIILLGITGWFGYVAEFGLTALPLLLLGREALIRRGSDFSPAVAALALIHAASMVDLLPNATHVPLTWLVAGALLGDAERLRRQRIALEGSPHSVGQARTVI